MRRGRAAEGTAGDPNVKVVVGVAVVVSCFVGLGHETFAAGACAASATVSF